MSTLSTTTLNIPVAGRVRMWKARIKKGTQNKNSRKADSNKNIQRTVCLIKYKKIQRTYFWKQTFLTQVLLLRGPETKVF